MRTATGPWCHPPELPDDPKALCLVLLEHPKFGRTFQIMRYVRRNWQFQEGLGMSNQRVVAWALIDHSNEIPVAIRSEERDPTKLVEARSGQQTGH